jgi:hypothetical protein
MRSLLLHITFLTVVVAATSPTPPCPVSPSSPPPSLCVVTADDAGTAAAWTAASAFNIPTALITWARRDIGGDLASAVRTDLFTSARNVGGLNYAYDRFARQDSDTVCGDAGTARIAPPGPSFVFLDGLLRAAEPTLQVLDGWMALPGAGVVQGGGGRSQKQQQQQRPLVAGLTLINATGSLCSLPCKYVIEGSGEGYALSAFNVSLRFGREGRVSPANSSCDETSCGESLAGRRMFGRCGQAGLRDCNSSDFAMGLAPPWLNVSDTSEETEDVSMAASGLLALRRYVAPGTPVPDDAPWLLRAAPGGYDPANYRFLGNVTVPPTEGYIGDNVSRCSFEHSYGLPKWYELPPGSGTHYRRIPGDPWAPKRAVETRSLAYAVGGLYTVQQHPSGKGREWGLDNASYPLDYRQGVGGACFTLSDVGTSAYGGASFEQISCRLYKRTHGRLQSKTPVGGQAMLPRPLFQRPTEPIVRTYWEPSSVGVPLYPVDYRGVLADTVPMPDYAGPEGLVSLVYGGIGGTDAHGLARRVIVPPGPEEGFSPGVPLNLLSPGAPRTTFMAQAAVRIHATASNLGVVAAAFVAAAEATGSQSVEDVPTALAQWVAVSTPRANAVVSFQDAGMAGSPSYALAQLPAVFGVPPGQIGSTSWSKPFPTHADATLWLSMYALGLFEGQIPRWPAPPEVPAPFPFPANITGGLPFANDTAVVTRADLVAALEALAPGSTSAAAGVLALPLADPSAPVHLRDWRAVLTRHILYMSGALSGPLARLAPYSFPAYLLVDSLNVNSGIPPSSPDHGAGGEGSCNTTAGLVIGGGVLFRNDGESPETIYSRLCAAWAPGNASSAVPPSFRLSAELVAEQTPVPGPGVATLTNAGILFLYGGPDPSQHGFFGLLGDENATVFAPEQSLTFGLRLPPPSGQLLVAQVPWGVGEGATFFLEVSYDNSTGTFSGLVNGAVVLSGTVPSPVPAPQFGVRVGEGPGRGLFAQIVLTEGPGEHRGDR